jgi:hypothetical protein
MAMIPMTAMPLDMGEYKIRPYDGADGDDTNDSNDNGATAHALQS